MSLKPTLVAVALTLALPLPALAADCSDWNTVDFFAFATVADVETCLTAGADIGARNRDGTTPLHWAAFNSTPQVVQTLIDAGAYINARDKNGVTPLHWAAVARRKNVSVIVQILIDAGANLEARDGGWDAENWTPLHAATANNATPAVVQTLIDAGADMTAKDKRDRIPFDLIEDDSLLAGTKVYWLLNEGQFK